MAVPNSYDILRARQAQQQGQQGPGLGYHNDYAMTNKSGGFTGIGSIPTTGGGGGGGGGGTAPQPQQQTQSSGPSPEEQARIDAENRVRSDINSGYDAYFSSLDQQMSGLGAQQQTQEGMVNNMYNQGVTDLTAQKESSQGDLNTQRRKTQEGQVSSLRDLSENIRNLFRTGELKLGAMGAGDSSAVNQYSYAVGKLGAKERGNVLTQSRNIENDIADRESKLNNIFTQETTKLKTNRDNQILQVAQWFQEKQAELQNMKGQGQLQKGQSLAQLSMSLLQEAQQRLMQVDADTKNKQSMLDQWAVSQSNTIGELKSNLAQVGGYQAAGITSNQLNGSFDAGGNYAAPKYYGGGGSSDELYKGLNGNQ